MRLFLRLSASVVVACLWSSSLLASQVFFEAGSDPSWRPPEGAEQDVLDQMHAVLGEMDEGRYEQAYWNLDPGLKSTMNQDQFEALYGSDRERLGRTTSLRVVRVTWSKPPARQHVFGVYASIDIIRTFERAQRDCGYVVMRQAPDDANWRLVRLDDHVMPDAVYDDMMRKGKGEKAEMLWAQLRRGCPSSR